VPAAGANAEQATGPQQGRRPDQPKQVEWVRSDESPAVRSDGDLPDQPLWWHSRSVVTVRTSAQRVAAVGEPDRRSLRERALVCEDGVGPPPTNNGTAGSATTVTAHLGGPRLASLDVRFQAVCVACRRRRRAKGVQDRRC